MNNERPYKNRARLAQAIINEMMGRTVYGSFRVTYVEGRDADLCKEAPYRYANLNVIIGEEGRSNFVCTVDLLNPDETGKGIDQLVNYGLLPCYFDAKDEEGER